MNNKMKRNSLRLQTIKINNLLDYLTTILKTSSVNKNVKLTNWFNKSVQVDEIDLKKFIEEMVDVSPIDIMILSIYYIEKIISKGIVLTEYNKFSILWITCMLSCKYVLAHDYDIPMEYLANLGGYSLDDYIKFESVILKDHLDWKLEISNQDYDRLQLISIKSK